MECVSKWSLRTTVSIGGSGVASLVGYCSPDSESEAASLTRVARAAAKPWERGCAVTALL